MAGPMIALESKTYDSKDDGTGKKHFSPLIPFAGDTAKLIVSLNVLSIDADAQVSLYLQHSLDGQNWTDAQTLAAAITTVSFNIFTTNNNYGPFVKIRMHVEDPTAPATVRYAECEVIVFGKQYVA